MTQIVVGVDGSDSSNKALEWALDQARLRGDAVLLLMHGYRPPASRNPYAYSYPYMPPGAVSDMVEQEDQYREQQETVARQHAEALIEGALDSAGGAPAGIAVKKVTMAIDPAKALVEASGDADLLVVGSRGRGGFNGLLLGSVSQQCVHHAPCPVVVVR
jgi:nucleotide-binding universal stress UspA family protein